MKTLKVLVKLILNCPRPHAITYTAMGSELFSCSPFREIYQNFAPKCNFVLLPISFPLGNFIRYDHFVTRKCSKFTNSLTVLSSHTSVDEKDQAGFSKKELPSSKSFEKSPSSHSSIFFSISIIWSLIG